MKWTLYKIDITTMIDGTIATMRERDRHDNVGKFILAFKCLNILI